MQRFDRILGLLLFLRKEQAISASELAKHFAVSRRTIYRDLETLSLLGVPLYVERGRDGGFQLLEGYFLPPLMFTQGEAVAILLGLSLQKNLRATPFLNEMLLAEKKLFAALPERMRSVLTRAEQLIGVEKLAEDIFHPESGFMVDEQIKEDCGVHESATISVFFQALLDGKQVSFYYPMRKQDRMYEVQLTPLGLFWDRDRWYLVGQRAEQPSPRMWRSDRVHDIRPLVQTFAPHSDFDIRTLLGHGWLQNAIAQWSQQFPVKIRLSLRLAQRLQRDWYYRHAHYEPLTDEQVLLTFGESDPTIVFELLRWLGHEAELLEPQSWRAKLRAEYMHMAEMYSQ